MPYSQRAKSPTEDVGRRDDNDHEPEQTYHEGCRSPAHALQRTAHRHGDGGDEKAQTDDPQRFCASTDGPEVGGKHPHEFSRECQTDEHAHRHDGCGHPQCGPGDPRHPVHLLGTVVVSHQRPDTLHDPVGGKIDEGLKLVIDSQDKDTGLAVGSEDAVQGGDKDGRQSLIEYCRDSYGIETPRQTSSLPSFLQIQMKSHPSPGIHHEIDHQCHRLSDIRGDGGAVDTQRGTAQISEDHDGIEDDVGDASRHHAVHGYLHPSRSLEQFLIYQLYGHDDGCGEDDEGIPGSEIEDPVVVGIHPQERRDDGKTDPGEKDAVKDPQQDPQRSRPGGFFLLLRTQIEGHRRIDAHAEPDAHRPDDVLNGKHQRQRRHGILADLRHEIAVDDVIQSVDQHGQHHGQ